MLWKPLRLFLSAGVLAMGIAALDGQQPKPAATARYRPNLHADTRLVVCHTTVMDKTGHLVTDLKPDAFSLRRTAFSRTSRPSNARTCRSPWG